MQIAKILNFWQALGLLKMREIWWNQGDIYFFKVYKKDRKPDVNEAGGTWEPEYQKFDKIIGILCQVPGHG